MQWWLRGCDIVKGWKWVLECSDAQRIYSSAGWIMSGMTERFCHMAESGTKL